MLENGASMGQITLSIIADELPELNEQFIVKLVSVDGGADIDATALTSAFIIRYVWRLSIDNMRRVSFSSFWKLVMLPPSLLIKG